MINPYYAGANACKMSRQFSPQTEVTVIGIGSAGVRIASALSKESLMIDRFAYISCDRSDLECVQSQRKLLIEGPIAQKLSPSMVRGLAIPHRAAKDSASA